MTKVYNKRVDFLKFTIKTALLAFISLNFLKITNSSVNAAKKSFENNWIVDILHKGKFLSYIGKNDPEFFSPHKEEYGVYFKTLLDSLNQTNTTKVNIFIHSLWYFIDF